MVRHRWYALCCTGLLTLAVPQPWAWATAGDPTPAARFDVVTHNEVVVNVAPAAIWPYVLRMDEWKKGARLIPISGSPEAADARFKAVLGGDSALFYVENVELIPNRVRTIRLNELDGTLIGYANLRLTPRGRTTLVQYDVYASIPPLPAIVASPPETRRAKQAGFTAESLKRFDEELVTLKRLAEKRQR